MSDGTVRPSSNHSRTNQLIPPHSPASASPTPTQRGSSTPSFTVGPEGYRLAKWRPLTDGRNPSTVLLSTIVSDGRTGAGRYGQSSGCSGSGDVEAPVVGAGVCDVVGDGCGAGVAVGRRGGDRHGFRDVDADDRRLDALRRKRADLRGHDVDDEQVVALRGRRETSERRPVRSRAARMLLASSTGVTEAAAAASTWRSSVTPSGDPRPDELSVRGRRRAPTGFRLVPFDVPATGFVPQAARPRFVTQSVSPRASPGCRSRLDGAETPHRSGR